MRKAKRRFRNSVAAVLGGISACLTIFAGFGINWLSVISEFFKPHVLAFVNMWLTIVIGSGTFVVLARYLDQCLTWIFGRRGRNAAEVEMSKTPEMFQIPYEQMQQ